MKTLNEEDYEEDTDFDPERDCLPGYFEFEDGKCRGYAEGSLEMLRIDLDRYVRRKTIEARRKAIRKWMKKYENLPEEIIAGIMSLSKEISWDEAETYTKLSEEHLHSYYNASPMDICNDLSGYGESAGKV